MQCSILRDLYYHIRSAIGCLFMCLQCHPQYRLGFIQLAWKSHLVLGQEMRKGDSMSKRFKGRVVKGGLKGIQSPSGTGLQGPKIFLFVELNIS